VLGGSRRYLLIPPSAILSHEAGLCGDYFWFLRLRSGQVFQVFWEFFGFLERNERFLPTADKFQVFWDFWQLFEQGFTAENAKIASAGKRGGAAGSRR